MNHNPQIEIRLADHNDAALILKMILALADSMGDGAKVNCTARDFEGALSGNSPAIHAFIAEQDSKAVGLAIFFSTFSTWRGSPGVYLQDIYVDAALRGAGVGRALLRAVAGWARQNGATHLRLSVGGDNVSAQIFYGSLGLGWRQDERIFEITGDAFEKIATQP